MPRNASRRNGNQNRAKRLRPRKRNQENPGCLVRTHPAQGFNVPAGATRLVSGPEFVRIRDNTIHEFIQFIPANSITSSNVGTSYAGFNFTLSQLDQAATWTAVFDQYQIARLEVRLIPRVDSNTTATTGFGLVYSAVDYDDSTAPPSVASLEQRENCNVESALREQSVVFTPHAALAAYSGVFTSFANVKEMWIDSGSATVQHYGFKTAWTSTTTNNQTIDVITRMVVRFRNVF